MIKLIIFDWDDVFSLGSTKGYYRCYHEAIKGVGISLNPEEEKARIAAKWGSSHQEEIRELLKEHPELIKNAVKLYEAHYFGDTFVSCLSIVPGSQQLLNRLSKNYKLALATGVHPKMLKEKVMPKFKIPDVFTQIITAYDVDDPSKTKPHAHIANTIMATQGMAPSETVMVGDAKNDVEMARNAGIEPIVVLTGHLSRQEAVKLNVQYIIEDITMIESVLANVG